jgi:hypothetical protein
MARRYREYHYRVFRQQNDGDQPGAEASYTYSPILITRWGGGIEHADVYD